MAVSSHRWARWGLSIRGTSLSRWGSGRRENTSNESRAGSGRTEYGQPSADVPGVAIRAALLGAEPTQNGERVRRALGVGGGPGALDVDAAVGWGLFSNPIGELLGHVLVGGADQKEFPAMDGWQPLFAQLLREVNRVGARGEIYTNLEFWVARLRRLLTLARNKRFVLGQLGCVVVR